MADTGEGREIKERTDAKEEEVVAEVKEVVAKVSDRNVDQSLRRRRRVNKKEDSASEPLAEWLQMTRVSGLAPFRTSERKGFYYGRITEQTGSHRGQR